MLADYAEDKHRKRMDVKRLIEAASNSMLSELSRDCQVHNKHGRKKCSQVDLSEIEVKEGKRSQSKKSIL